MGREEEAREILGRLRTEDGDTEAPQAVAEFEDILAAVALEKEHTKRNSYISMFFGRNDGNLHIARRVQLSIWLQIVQEYDVSLYLMYSLIANKPIIQMDRCFGYHCIRLDYLLTSRLQSS